MQTLFGAALRRHAAAANGVAAIAMARREIGYAELLRAVDCCAAWLARRGCAASEVVGITIGDEYTHTVASLALLALGIPQICLPTRDPQSMRRHLAQRIPVRRVVVTDVEHAVDGVETLLLTPEILQGSATAQAIDADLDAPAVYFASSGTTGESKIFALSQRAMAWRAERIAESEQVAAG